MKLRISRTAKLFNIREETLRYYEKEGFLTPQRDPDNGYRLYTTSDILQLTDLLFYRDIGIPIADIRRILDGMEPEQITSLIEEKQRDVEQEIRRLRQSQIKLERWKAFHRQSLSHIGQFDICPMPAVLVHKKAVFTETADAAEGFAHMETADTAEGFGRVRRRFLPWPKELSFFATFSFYCDLSRRPATIDRYVVLDQSIADDLSFSLNEEEYLTEQASRCLFTVAEYRDDPAAMLSPLADYAKAHDLALAGPVYGRQSINDYSHHSMREYYRIYAPLKNESETLLTL